MTVEEAWRSLSLKQREFVRQYLILGNASKAMRLAGYKSKNPDVDAAKLLVIPRIKAILDDEYQKTQTKFSITKDEILIQMRNLAYGHIGQICTWDEFGKMKVRPSEDLTPENLRFIESITQTSRTYDNGAHEDTLTVKVLAGSRLRALNDLGDKAGVWKDDSGSREADQRNRELIRNRLFERIKAGGKSGGTG